MSKINKKPRIALMSYSMDNRRAKGTALYTRKLIENLLDDDQYDFYLVHYDAVDDPLYARANEIIMPSFKFPYGARFIRQMLFFWKYRNDKFDIIHWFQPRLYPLFWLAPARKLVVTLHGAGDVTAPSSFVFSRSVFNFTLIHWNRFIDIAIGDSSYAKYEIIEHYDIPRDKVRSIFLGGGEDFKPVPKIDAQEIISSLYNIPTPFILDVSRMVPHKNIECLVRAYFLMKDNHSVPHHLVIVGDGTYGREALVSLVENSLYKDFVHFVTYVDAVNLNSLYSAADLFVFPSLNEGFGLPIIEAMASGTPVVTSNVTSMPEIAEEAAVIIDPYNCNSIAEGIYKVISHDNLKQEFIAKGLKRAKEFTWKRTAKEVRDCYRELIIQNSSKKN